MIERRSSTARMLLVDDDPAAVMLLRIALEESGLPVQLDVATSFRGALERLRSCVEYPQAAPSLALLDLNLGDGSGHDLLAFMRSQPALADIPTLILSTSSYAKDIARATAAGADDYIVKPSSYDQLVSVLSGLQRYLQPLLAQP